MKICSHCGKETEENKFCNNCGYFCKRKTNNHAINEKVFLKSEYEITFFIKKTDVLKKVQKQIIFLSAMAILLIAWLIISAVVFGDKIENLFSEFFTEMYYLFIIFFFIILSYLVTKKIIQTMLIKRIDDKDGYAVFFDSMTKPLKVIYGDSFYYVTISSKCPVCGNDFFIEKDINKEYYVVCANSNENRHYFYINTEEIKEEIKNRRLNNVTIY